ncbi:RluA family pseudouridine synthase [Marinimicrobium sp. ABcell2]|uniref:RluA family pseudouridine synthase n=1 Tax=Marinimicrobium sp. ABcell2 TaxID=3069751 RepID=UPI0027AE1F9F|nr:RluA family pseudouridine synthase [Marinimicrobium sp. ABcell2]MDQ2077998.1 RluA family pseudouridine synthase [Marinimicrobium sp. ABcell2]
MSTALPDILHRCDAFLIVDKPAGLLTVPGKGPEKWDCLINRLLPAYPNARIVHRLDQPTSGLLVVPLGYEPLRHIGRQFEQREVSKTYQAVVNGLMADDEGEVDLPLICDWPNRPRQMVDHEQGKPSLTRYRVMRRDMERQLTRVELTPVTGRSHQLRVHMLAIGHPILGDTLYTPGAIPVTATRLHLHACTLAFTDPGDGTRVCFRSAPAF